MSDVQRIPDTLMSWALPLPTKCAHNVPLAWEQFGAQVKPDDKEPFIVLVSSSSCLKCTFSKAPDLPPIPLGFVGEVKPMKG